MQASAAAILMACSSGTESISSSGGNDEHGLGRAKSGVVASVVMFSAARDPHVHSLSWFRFLSLPVL